MKSLEQIKQEYALQQNFLNWNHFCQVANDKKFIKAIDEIARLYANSKAYEDSLKKENGKKHAITDDNFSAIYH